MVLRLRVVRLRDVLRLVLRLRVALRLVVRLRDVLRLVTRRFFRAIHYPPPFIMI